MYRIWISVIPNVSKSKWSSLKHTHRGEGGEWGRESRSLTPFVASGGGTSCNLLFTNLLSTSLEFVGTMVGDLKEICSAPVRLLIVGGVGPVTEAMKGDSEFSPSHTLVQICLEFFQSGVTSKTSEACKSTRSNRSSTVAGPGTWRH